MQRALQDHVAFLEEQIAKLESQANDLGRTAAERYQSSVDLGIAKRALVHFRKAYELEQEAVGRISN